MIFKDVLNFFTGPIQKISGHVRIPKPVGIVDVFPFHQTSFPMRPEAQHLRGCLISSLWAHSLPAKRKLLRRATQRTGIDSCHRELIRYLAETYKIISMFILGLEMLKRLNHVDPDIRGNRVNHLYTRFWGHTSK